MSAHAHTHARTHARTHTLLLWRRAATREWRVCREGTNGLRAPYPRMCASAHACMLVLPVRRERARAYVFVHVVHTRVC